MRARCDRRSSTKNHLAAHELAVVFAKSTRHGGKTWVAEVCALGPLPHIPEHLRRTLCRPLAQGHGVQRSVLEKITGCRQTLCRDLPLGLSRQPLAGPARKSVCFVKAHMAHRSLQQFGEWQLAA